MQLGLADRVVLVTGGSRGIGRAVATAFAAEGARVALTYHSDKDSAQQLVDALGADRALAVRYALDEPGSAQDCVAAVTAHWGDVDVLVANAHRKGARRPPDRHFEDIPPADWHSLVTGNLTGVLTLAQLVLPGMRSRGWGRLVLISSHNVRDGARGQEFYGAAKGGLHGLARSLAFDAGPDGVLVNVVAPGLTATDAVLTMLPEQVRATELGRTPTGRLTTPEDVAAATVFLASAVNASITGEVLTVAGGR